jgi:hypothetical protein
MASQQRRRLPNANANGYTDRNGDSHCDGNSYTYRNRNPDGNGYSDAYSYSYCDSDAHGDPASADAKAKANAVPTAYAVSEWVKSQKS